MRLDEFVTARGHALLQLAALLSRDPADAPRLLDDALADVVPHWRHAERDGPEDAVARLLVQATLRHRNHHADAEHAPTGAREWPGRREPGDLGEPVTAGNVVRGFLHDLPPRARCVLVLRMWLDMDDAQVADLLDTSPASVRVTADKHLARLRAALPGHDVEAELRHVLLSDADAVPQPSPDLPDDVTVLARRRRRRRVTSAAAACLLVGAAGLVGVPWLADVTGGPKPDVDASLAEPLRVRECPGGRLHTATDPWLSPSQPRARTVDDMLDQGWIATARPRYPDARPHLAVRTSSTRAYVFLTPDGRRVGIIHLAFVGDAWQFVHLEYC